MGGLREHEHAAVVAQAADAVGERRARDPPPAREGGLTRGAAARPRLEHRVRAGARRHVADVPDLERGGRAEVGPGAERAPGGREYEGGHERGEREANGVAHGLSPPVAMGVSGFYTGRRARVPRRLAGQAPTISAARRKASSRVSALPSRR